MEEAKQTKMCNDVLESMRKVSQHTNMDHYQKNRCMNKLYNEYLEKCSDKIVKKFLDDLRKH